MSMEKNVPDMVSDVLRPETFLSSALLAIASTSGLYYLVILPVFVPQLQSLFAIGPAESGLVTSTDAYVAVFSAFVVSLYVHRIRWRPVAAAGLVVIALCEAATPFIVGVPTLIALRAVHGLASGVETALISSVIGRSRAPDRTYGLVILYQALIGALALFVFPRIVGDKASPLVFEVLAIATIAAIGILPFLREPSTGNDKRSRAERRALPAVYIAAAVAAVYLFQAFHTALVTFALGLAQSLSLVRIAAADGIGIGRTAGVVGALMVVLIGLRFGRVRPLFLIPPAALVVGLTLLSAGGNTHIWIAAQILDGTLTTYALPLLLGSCASTDPGGRAAIFAMMASKTGLATGPAIGGLIIEHSSYSSLVISSAAGVMIASVFGIVAARKIAAVVPSA